MLTGSKLFQIFTLCSATVDLSQILFKERTKEKRLHKYHPTPSISLEKTQLCTAMEILPQARTMKDFINRPALEMD